MSKRAVLATYHLCNLSPSTCRMPLALLLSRHHSQQSRPAQPMKWRVPNTRRRELAVGEHAAIRTSIVRLAKPRTRYGREHLLVRKNAEGWLEAHRSALLSPALLLPTPYVACPVPRMPSRVAKLLATDAHASVVLVRIALGIIFVSEGFQKFLFADAQGAGRFAKIGIPAPQLLGPFVGAVEIASGALVLVGLLTRVAALALVVDMLVALATTKVPIWLGHGYWRFSHTFAPKSGGWALLHESRTDLAMLLCAAMLTFAGAGAWSLDAMIAARGQRSIP
jgi:putative oxidoreductase